MVDHERSVLTNLVQIRTLREGIVLARCNIRIFLGNDAMGAILTRA